MTINSPTRLYAGLFGAVLVVAGIIGASSTSRRSPTTRRCATASSGSWTSNGWHNVVHIATGLLGLVAFGAGAAASRQYALGLGVVYIAVAVWGSVVGDGDSILSIIRSTPRTTSCTS